jgi:hypothetical protein
MRYSTEPGDPGFDDPIPQPRGLGMKVFNVRGAMFDAAKEFSTQDIEFNSTHALDLVDTKTTKEIIDLRIKYGGDKKELYKHLEARRDAELQKARNRVRSIYLEVCYIISSTAELPGARPIADYSVNSPMLPDRISTRRLYREILSCSFIRDPKETL